MEQKSVVLKNGSSFKKLVINEILYCTSLGSYTKIKTHQEMYCDTKLLKEYELKLGDNGFFRINRSKLVNLCYCVEINIGRSPFLMLENGEELQISIRRLAKVIKAFKAYT